MHRKEDLGVLTMHMNGLEEVKRDLVVVSDRPHVMGNYVDRALKTA